MPFCSECGTPMSGSHCPSCGQAFVGGYDDGGYGGGYDAGGYDGYDGGGYAGGGYEGGYEGGYDGDTSHGYQATPAPSSRAGPPTPSPTSHFGGSHSAPTHSPMSISHSSASYSSTPPASSSPTVSSSSSSSSGGGKSFGVGKSAIGGGFKRVKQKASPKGTQKASPKATNSHSAPGPSKRSAPATKKGIRAPTKSVYMSPGAQRNRDSPRVDEGRSFFSMGHALKKTLADKNFDRITKGVQGWSAKDYVEKARDDYIGNPSSGGGGGGGGRKPAPPSVKKGKALFEWVAENDIELPSMKVGDIVEIIEDDDPEWFLVTLKGEEGFVPRSYIAVLKSRGAVGKHETQYIQSRRDKRERTRTVIQGDPDTGVYFRLAESFHTKVGRDRYMCYAVLCKWAGVEWTIFRRFKQFYEFSLKARRLGIPMPYPFPPKVAWKSKAHLREREKMLRLWIFGISETHEQWIKHEKRKAAVVRCFGPSQLGDVKKHAQSTMPFRIGI